MIVQACLNGARPEDFHPRLPITAEAIALDGAACVSAGAAELHVHPRGRDGRESLLAVDEAMHAVRRTCPGTLVGVSTGAWIERDEKQTRACISAWRLLPDYASVNLSERDAPAVIALLHRMGVGVEAGLATVADAERFVTLPDCHRAFRILIEIEEQDPEKADEIADAIAQVLERADIRRSILLHGVDSTVWHFVKRAHQRRWSTRVGLEDGYQLTNGETAVGNADLVSGAFQIFTLNHADGLAFERQRRPATRVRRHCVELRLPTRTQIYTDTIRDPRRYSSTPFRDILLRPVFDRSREEIMASADWRLEGEWLKNCNCAFGCPCDFNARPTNGECEGLVAMRITKGHFNDVSLDGLHFAVTVHFPGPLHEGNGDAQPILDERASPEQREALGAILSGQNSAEGTLFHIVSIIVARMHEPIFAPFEFSFDMAGRTARMVVPGVLETEVEPIKNPVTGEPHRAQVLMPEGFEHRMAEIASSNIRSMGAIKFQTSGAHSSLAHVVQTPQGVAA